MNPLHPASQDAAFNVVNLLLRIGLVAAGAFVAVRIAYFLISRIERAIREERRGTEISRQMRAKTVGDVLRQFARMILVVIAILMGVRELGLDITPALAAAGGFGVAAGLGAQTLIRDWISGFFIIHDNQFAVGDVVRIGGASGTVEMLSLRHTELRDSEGFIHFIANGEIKQVTNLTKSWSTPIVRIPISLVEAPDRVLDLIEATLLEFRENPKVKPHLLEAPRLLGIDDVGAGQFTVIIQSKTVPEQRLFVARALRLALLERLYAEGIAIHTAAGQDAAAPAPAPAATTDEAS